MKRSASPTPSLRRSKRSKRPPTRTPQTVAERLAQPDQQSPDELIALGKQRLIAKLAVLQRKAERESRMRTPKRDTEFYLSDPFFYETRDPSGTSASVEVAHEEMLIFLVENTLFRLPRPALVAHSELFANMFTFPPPPDETSEGRSDERPIVLHGMHAEGMRQFVYWWIDGAAMCIHFQIWFLSCSSRTGPAHTMCIDGRRAL
ncbi:hypothetical protein PENSPDRAFT_150147 [Peniophora sp. CONT]|nr:hypothetical protein PENSPDRAFT_150147 [Peniophora sp. CONT]